MNGNVRFVFAFALTFLLNINAISATNSTLDVSVPFNFDICGDFDKGIADLRRLRTEFGVKRVFLVGCPGLETRIVGWQDDDAPFVRFGEMLAKIRDAVKDTGLEIGWWISPTLACAKGGPFQFMVGCTGREALHAPCLLDQEFVKAFCRRMKIVARKGRPAAILFEDDLRFSSQRDKTNDDWTGECCYCPLHLDALFRKSGHRYTREELVKAMGAGTSAANNLRKQFDETLVESMHAFGRAIRMAVDEVSPETRMGMSGSHGIDDENSPSIAFARVIAGKYKPFIRIPCSRYDANGSLVDMLDCMCRSFSFFLKCPRDIERMHEMDTYPHNHFFMPEAEVSSLMATAIAWGGESVLFYGSQYLDNPLEADGYFECLKRENRKLATLRDEIKGMRLGGVVSAAANGEMFPLSARYGIPLCSEGDGPILLAGSVAQRMNDKELVDLLENGGVVLDGVSAGEVTRRGLAHLIGAEVQVVKEFPIFGEQITELGATRHCEGRRIYNFNFAAATVAEKSMCATIRPLSGAKVESLVDYVDVNVKPYAPSVCRMTTATGKRVGVILTNLCGNRSSALFSRRKREVICGLLEWVKGRELAIRVSEECNVALIENVDAANTCLIVTAIVLRPDILNHLDFVLGDGWGKAVVEELHADGQWREVALKPMVDSRVHRCVNEFRPGVSRIFRFSKR